METKIENSEVKLSDGRIVKKRENVKVGEFVAASNQPVGKEYLIPYATFAAKILINEKQAVLEDILDMREDDFLLITDLFIDEEEEKNV